ncbi:acyltransferase [Proteus mirabilis]|nr:acyltransferase [Proteus mirabilis]
MQSKKFRADINGLRAIAVLSVMFFHFNKELAPSGFAGVDVFFVISGFLMTSIIFRGLENNNFYIWNFLKARAKRIVPALVTIISITLAMGYLFLEPTTYKLAGEHGLSSLLFISNITYANESGYFDVDSFSKLFLHTWSLSVEWQFYILYPIALVALSKIISIKNLKKVVLLLAIFSFIFCVYFSSKDKTLSYFMIYTRAWEMLLGGVAFLFPLKTTDNKKRAIEVLGLILIIISFFIFSDADAWPSYNAMLPVFGAYLCILSNSNKTLLSNIVFQKIGLWSYSIYLVHWPLIVFLKKINIDISIYSYFIFTLLMAFINFQLIEKKRNYGYKSLSIYLLALLSSFYISKNGISDRIEAREEVNFHQKYYGGSGISDEGNAIRFNDKKDVKFILVGDSFARQYANFMKNKGIGFIGVFQDGCFSMEGYHSAYSNRVLENCINRFESLKKSIIRYPNAKVLIAQKWNRNMPIYTNGDNSEVFNKNYISDYVNSIKNMTNSDIYVIGTANGSKKNVFECFNNNKLPIYKYLPKLSLCSQPEEERENAENEYIKKTSEHLKINYIDVNRYLCSKGKCIVVDDNNMPIYSDESHFSIYGSEYIGNEIMDNLNI